MRTVSLNVFEEKGDFVESVSSASAAVLAPFTEGDTIQFAVTKVVRPSDPSKTLSTFVLNPWDFTQIRVSIGYIDRAMESGTFKLKVHDDLTAAITWPTDLSAGNVATWK